MNETFNPSFKEMFRSLDEVIVGRDFLDATGEYLKLRCGAAKAQFDKKVRL